MRCLYWFPQWKVIITISPYQLVFALPPFLVPLSCLILSRPFCHYLSPHSGGRTVPMSFNVLSIYFLSTKNNFIIHFTSHNVQCSISKPTTLPLNLKLPSTLSSPHSGSLPKVTFPKPLIFT